MLMGVRMWAAVRVAGLQGDYSKYSITALNPHTAQVPQDQHHF